LRRCETETRTEAALHRRVGAALAALALALGVAATAAAQQPSPRPTQGVPGTRPAATKAAPPVATPTAPPGFLTPAPTAPGKPEAEPAGQTAGLTPLPSPTPPPPPTLTPTATLTPTQTPTRTSTPFPTYLPAATPTLAWPTPAPSAHFISRYVAMVTDPTPTTLGSGGLRGRVLDWRGIGQANFRVHAVGERMQAEGVSSADGQYQIVGLAPGNYEVRLADFRSEPARDIPIVASQITTVDWIEASRGGVAPPPQPVPRTATPLPPTPTPTAVPANLVQRPPGGPARPSPPELAVLEIISFAAGQLMTAFLTGAAVVTVAAVLTVAIARRRRA
jgi:hypothetical protein